MGAGASGKAPTRETRIVFPWTKQRRNPSHLSGFSVGVLNFEDGVTLGVCGSPFEPAYAASPIPANSAAIRLPAYCNAKHWPRLVAGY